MAGVRYGFRSRRTRAASSAAAAWKLHVSGESEEPKVKVSGMRKKRAGTGRRRSVNCQGVTAQTVRQVARGPERQQPAGGCL